MSTNSLLSKKREKVRPLLRLRQARRSFLIEYICGFSLLLFLLVFKIENLSLSPILHNFVLGLSLFTIGSVEFRRYTGFQYDVLPKKLIITEGIIKQQKKNVYYTPLGFIPDMNLHQSRVERLLNYGTITVKISDQNRVEIKNICEPQKVVKLLEDLLKENKHIVRGGSGLQKVAKASQGS